MRGLLFFKPFTTPAIIAGLLLTNIVNGLPFSPSADQPTFDKKNNLAVYWGQNSYGQATGPYAQMRLVDYCANSNIDIIPMAFLFKFGSREGNELVLNFANQEMNCSLFPGTEVANCPEIGNDIKTCQQVYGKKILLSIGGATYSGGGFASVQDAISTARLIMHTFGPITQQSVTTNAAMSTGTPVSQVHGLGNSTFSNSTLSNPTFSNSTFINSPFSNSTLSNSTFINSTLSKSTLSNSPFSNSTLNISPFSNSTLSNSPFSNSTLSNSTLSNSPFSNSTSNGVWLDSANWNPTQSRDIATRNTVDRRSTAALRPFQDAVIDGFDLDFESPVQFGVTFARTLRSLMDADSSKEYYLTAAPQCPYPDLAEDQLLNSDVYFDAVFVQFYNNYCGLQSFTPGATKQLDFNFGEWNQWAIQKGTKIFLGIPAGPTAASSGYQTVAELGPIISYSQRFSHFGGVMMWDGSQAFANQGFVSGVRDILDSTTHSKRMYRRGSMWR